MFTLPILPEEIRIPLDRYEVEGEDGKSPVVICEYPGVTAYARPFDLETASRYNDEVFGDDAAGRSLAATLVVFRNVTRIDGFGMQDPETGKVVPFDASNTAHKRSIPMKMRDAIYLAIRKRAELPAVTEKNSVSPSVSGGTTSSVASSAEPVANEPATSTSAG